MKPRKYFVLRRKADGVFFKSLDAWDTDIADARRFDGDIEQARKSVETAINLLVKSDTRRPSDYETVQVDATFSLTPLD